MSDWLPKLGIDRSCRLVGMCRGMIALTAEPDETHTLWVLGVPIATGNAVDMRNRYADYLAGQWLERLYR